VHKLLQNSFSFSSEKFEQCKKLRADHVQKIIRLQNIGELKVLALEIIF